MCVLCMVQILQGSGRWWLAQYYEPTLTGEIPVGKCKLGVAAIRTHKAM